MAVRSVLILGLGPFGGQLAVELTSFGYEVLGVDEDEDKVAEISDSISKAVQGDVTSPGLWRDLPVGDIDIAIVAFSYNMADNIQTVVLLKKAGVPRIIAKSENEFHAEVLRSLGVSAILEPYKDSVARAVHILGTNLLDYLPVYKDFGIAIVKASPKFKGLTVQKLYQKYKATTLILRRGDKIIEEPSDHENIFAGDILVISARDRDLHDLPGVEVRPEDVDKEKNGHTPS
jgi:trk system potassium uptake protein TrkA